jgi:EmrB/QacA subfamily drug resistance transporter
MPATTTTSRAAPAARTASESRPHETSWWPLTVLMAGTFMVVLDFFAVNVAIPSLQAGLHASPTGVEWVVAGYGVTLSTFLMAAGRLGDRIGRRSLFGAGLALFTLASATCGLAPSTGILIVSRLVQGLGAAMVTPSVLSLIGVLYPGARRAKALSIYGMVAGGGAVAGQLIGGALIVADVAGTGWRSVFLINVPVGLAGIVFGWRSLPESKSERPGRIDLAGMALVTAGLVALVLPLIDGRQAGWAAWTWVSLGLAPLLLGTFIAHQLRLGRRGGSPLLDVRLWSVPTFRWGLVGQLAFWSGQASLFLYLALYLQEGRGLRPLPAGGVVTIMAAAYLVVSLRAPQLTVRYGRRVTGAGAATMAVGHAVLLAGVLAAGTGGSLGYLLPGLILVGAGMGACVSPLTMVVLSSADAERVGAVSGALATMQQVGNTLGVALTGLLFYGTLRHGYPHALAVSLGELAVLLAVVAGLTRLLPGPSTAETDGD